MTIYFCNAEPINLLAFEIMGLNVKTNDSPIGYFGTGLKFAIATLLRTGHKIAITRVTESTHELITFAGVKREMRGQEFEQVEMQVVDAGNGKIVRTQTLGFTTELGKNWTPWMAYRELHSNVLDEQGQTMSSSPMDSWGTVIAVTGQGIEEAWAKRDEIFLPTKSLTQYESANNGEIEVYHRAPRFLYYRGVRVNELQTLHPYTINITTGCTLTEDRQLTSLWYIPSMMGRFVQGASDEAFVEQALLNKDQGRIEPQMTFTEYEHVSDQFMKICERHRNNTQLNQKARELWQKKRVVPQHEQEEDVQLNGRQFMALGEAQAILRNIDISIERKDFRVVKGLGAGIMGCYRRGEILIAESTFDQGSIMLAGTLAEEYWHKTEMMRDETREFQNFLINKIMTLAQDR